MLSTVAVERLGIPKVHVTDGPNGARGNTLPGMGGAPSACIPCGSALGATWDPALVETLGALVGREARDRGCRGLLAPTVNLHRSPLAGRNFECYSEDPLLSGRLAAGYVARRPVRRGLRHRQALRRQRRRVRARARISSVIDERSLRELYLVPFEIAVGEGGALAIMTAYNRLNGRWLTQQPEIPPGHPPRRVGIRRPGDDRLVRRHRHQGVARCRPRSRNARPGTWLGSDCGGRRREGRCGRGRSRRRRRPAARGSRPDWSIGRAGAGGRTQSAIAGRGGVAPACRFRGDGVALERRCPPTGAISAGVALLGAPALTPTIMGGGSAQVTPHHVESVVHALTMRWVPTVRSVYERGCEPSQSATVVGGPVLRAPDGFVAEIHAGLARRGSRDRDRADSLSSG